MEKGGLKIVSLKDLANVRKRILSFLLISIKVYVESYTGLI